MRLILASASPRRAEILRDAGIAFETCSVQVDESRLAGEASQAMVTRIADSKARAAAALFADTREHTIIVGADTTVVLGDEIFEKPRDVADARRMLSALSGKTHRVLTGVCVLRLPGGDVRTAVESTNVTFTPLTGEEIEAYTASIEPLDKAGAYAIQGFAGRWIPRIEGCYFNVVGLPLARLCAMLRELGWEE